MKNRLSLLWAFVTHSNMWPLLTSMALLVAFSVGFYWNVEVRTIFCTGAKDEHCAREWVSVVSTLVAALVGAVAACFAYGNLREINRVQKENAYIQLMGRISLAKEVTIVSQQNRPSRLWMFVKISKEAKRVSASTFARMAGEGASELAAYLENPVIQEFVKLFGIVHLRNEALFCADAYSARAAEFSQHLAELEPNSTVPDHMFEMVDSKASRAFAAFEDLEKQITGRASNFIRRWDIDRGWPHDFDPDDWLR